MNTQEKVSRATEARRELIRISNIAKMIQDQSFENLTINQIIVREFYQTNEHREFNTFKGWKEKGMKVKKGERGKPIWARKQQLNKKEEPNGIQDKQEKQEEFSFFPIAYIFSNQQVEEM